MRCAHVACFVGIPGIRPGVAGPRYFGTQLRCRQCHNTLVSSGVIQAGTNNRQSHEAGVSGVTGAFWCLQGFAKSDVPGSAFDFDGMGNLLVERARLSLFAGFRVVHEPISNPT
jgi:hypothetical protein